MKAQSDSTPAGQLMELPDPLSLDSGEELGRVTIAYETYGALAADKGNAILICHALTGDQHVAGTHPISGKPGWWARMVGPGKPIDTDKFHVICANVIGSCMGSTGPQSINPETPRAGGTPYGMDFPVITIRDMVRASVAMLDSMGIDRLHAVVGGSMGGMQALSLAAHWPKRAERVLAIATAARHSAQNIAFHEVGRQAIMADPHWQGGDYYAADQAPDAGLAVARMAAHITYLSEEGLTRKFGRRFQDRPGGEPGAKSFGFDADFQVESYLRYQGSGFTQRFDANSYLYITRAMDYFDLAEEGAAKDASEGGSNPAQSASPQDGTYDGPQDGSNQTLREDPKEDPKKDPKKDPKNIQHAEPSLARAFAAHSGAEGARFCVVSFDSDWLYPTAESRHVVHALNAAGAAVSFVELSAPFGHDSFLLDVPALDRVVKGFLHG